MGTGTGVWLKDVAQALDHHQHPEWEFLGFDISPKQFPSQKDRLEFVVHDMTRPFHHEHFDLVPSYVLSTALVPAFHVSRRKRYVRQEHC